MVRRKSLPLALAVFAFGTALCFAEELSIQVRGLLKNTAIVEINGTPRTLKVGKISPEGIVLKSSNSRRAVIEYQGKEQTLTMDSSAPVAFHSLNTDTGSNTPGVKKDLQLIRQPDGMFRVQGLINNTHVHFLIDTGATTIAMNHFTAERIGIPYLKVGREIQAATASGVVKAYAVMLNRVRVGELELSNVEGAVIVGTQPDKVLLGMSFLDKFKVQQDGNKMVIGTRH